MEVGKKLKFNTGRAYSAEGQVIEAEIIALEEDWLFEDTMTAKVQFRDLTRGVSHLIQVAAFNQAAIMAEYDAMRYLN